MAQADTPAGAASMTGLAAPGLTDARVRASLWLLLLIYTLNFVDRQIVAVLGEDIKRDLRLDDAQFGMLGGLAFALFYTVLGIPIARYAERGDRVKIIAAALAVWSGFTALCGMAASFAQILAFRVGVGVGEAGCTPPAHSLISDYVRPERRASALALYSMGVPIGTFFGFALGAVIAHNFGWRAAFFAVGLPGVVLALVTLATLKEPRRALRQTTQADKPEFSAALKELGAKPAYWHCVFAATIVAFLGYGHAYFLPAYLARTHGMGLQERGLAFAIMVLIAGVIGTWAGGHLVDKRARRDPGVYAALPGWAFLLGVPFFVAGMMIPAGAFDLGGTSISSAYVALALLAVPTAANSVWYGPIYAAIQNLAAPQTRATAVAIMFFILNLIGLGLGPTVVGVLSDLFAGQTYGPGFDAACPAGGQEPACLAAQAEGLRQSLLWSALVGVGALIFFALGARALRRMNNEPPATA